MSKVKWLLLFSILALLLAATGCVRATVVEVEPTAAASPLPEITRVTPTMTLAPSVTSTFPPVVPTTAPTPTPTVTAVPTEAPSTGDGSLSQAVTSTVAMSETLTTAPILAPPAPTINTKDIYERLWRVSGFVVDVVASLESDRTIRFVGTRVNSPGSWKISWLPSVQGGEGLVDYVSIGARNWVQVARVQSVPPCDATVSPTNNPDFDFCDFGADLQTLAQATLGILSSDQVVDLIDEKAVLDDGTACHEYKWRDTSAALWSMCLASETGLPIRLSTESVTVQFSHYNDPANAIAPPASEMPDRLHIDDARMALNSLSSFRYVTDGEVRTPAGQPTTYHVEGTYIQDDQGWQTEWKWKAEDAQPVIEFLSIEDQTWFRDKEEPPWVDFSRFEDLFEDFRPMVNEAGPFSLWPDASGLAGGVGVLQAGPPRTVGGLQCNDYLFEGTKTTDTGAEVSQRASVCATPAEMLPLQIEITLENADKGVFVTVKRELSHINDPANLVESPQR